jgi:DNA-binding NarL/FixJ family response regulator
VLLIDDDARFADVVRSALVEDGYDVVEVVSAADAAESAVARHGPDVVVLDLVLPGGDGLELADRLRAAHPRLPVVVFSSLFDQRIGRDTLAAGFGYVEKAAGVEALELALEAAVGLAAVIDLREVNAPNDG